MLPVILCCLLGYAWGQGSSPCCTPDVWEGEAHTFSGYVASASPEPLTRNDHTRILYDYTEKKRAYFFTAFFEDETFKSYRYIADHNGGKQYVIYQNTCKTRTLTKNMTKDCISSESKYYGDIFYGANTHTLMAKRYYDRIVTKQGKDIGAVYFTVTKDSCVPIEELTYAAGPGTRSVDVVRGGTYLNVVPEIRDREDLVPPETCQVATDEEWAELEKLPGSQYWSGVFTQQYHE